MNGFACQLCGITCATMSGLRRHAILHHRMIPYLHKDWKEVTDAEYPTLKDRYKRHANRPSKRHRRNGALFGDLSADEFDWEGFGAVLGSTNSVASDTIDLNLKQDKSVAAKDFRFNGVLELPLGLNYVDLIAVILEKPELTTSGVVQYLSTGQQTLSEFGYYLLTSLDAMAQLTLVTTGCSLMEQRRCLEMAREHMSSQEYSRLLANQRLRITQLSSLQVSRADVERRGTDEMRIEPGDRIIIPSTRKTGDADDQSMVDDSMENLPDDGETIEFSVGDDPYL